jgi:exonuclease SbcC
MGIKIEKLRITNFKIYKDHTFDFQDNSLVVFDGPNGFGKSSIYDAIELIFTSKIRRYDQLNDFLNDGREKKKENPFLYIEAEENAEITVRIQFAINDITYILARNNNQADEPVINFEHYQLHLLSEFTETPSGDNQIQNEKEFFTNLFGENYISDFEFVNYVEQEDTFYYLKSKEREKKKGINYLFNTTQFNEKIERFTSISQRINTVLHEDNGVQPKIDELSISIASIKESLQKNEETAYERIFSGREIIWDEEKVDFNNVSFENLFDPEMGDFVQVERLIQNKDKFLIEFQNKAIDRIIEDNSTLESFFYFQYFRLNESQIKEEKKLLREFDDLSEAFESFELDDVNENIFDIPELMEEKFFENSIVIEYKQKLIDLKLAVTTANSASLIYSSVIASRETLKNHLEKYHKEIHDDGHCPLCGYDHKTKEELFIKIDEYRGEIEKLNKNLDQNLKNKIELFITFFTEKFSLEMKSNFEDFLYEPAYFENEFFETSNKREEKILIIKFADLEFNFENFVSKETSKKEGRFEGFVSELRTKKIYLETSVLTDELGQVFVTYFNAKKSALRSVELDQISTKKKYINWLFSIHQNQVIKVKEEALKILNVKSEKLNRSKDKIDQIIEQMRKALIWYNTKLVNDLELLFHLYSARIMQTYQGGLGLFIINKDSTIKFVTSPSNTYDAVFSMSTGQLSALILSFTLALNKKYSTSKLLLIDDPVQSMDDINTAGFIEVLRNDFSDRQIFISTHEQMMSTYVRYKFKKFGFDSVRFNLSEL